MGCKRVARERVEQRMQPYERAAGFIEPKKNIHCSISLTDPGYAYIQRIFIFSDQNVRLRACSFVSQVILFEFIKLRQSFDWEDAIFFSIFFIMIVSKNAVFC